MNRWPALTTGSCCEGRISGGWRVRRVDLESRRWSTGSFVWFNRVDGVRVVPKSRLLGRGPRRRTHDCGCRRAPHGGLAGSEIVGPEGQRACATLLHSAGLAGRRVVAATPDAGKSPRGSHTAPVHGHRTSSGAAACPVHGRGSYRSSSSWSSYSPPSYSSPIQSRTGGGSFGSSSGGRSTRPRWSPASSPVTYTSDEVAALDRYRAKVEAVGPRSES